jgi:choline-sulfatase
MYYEVIGMNNPHITRRDFLKLASLMPFLCLASGSPLRIDQPGNNDGLPNILILVFDAFSAKHLALHGYHRRTTPNLDELVGRATVFHNHYAGGNFTIPGTASLLTGTYPFSHRTLNMYGTAVKYFERRNLFAAIGERYTKIAFTHNLMATILLHQFSKNLNTTMSISEASIIGDTYSEHIFRNDYSVGLWSEVTLRGLKLPLTSSLFYSIYDKQQTMRNIFGTLDDYSSEFPRGLPNNHTGHFFLLERTVDWIKDQITKIPKPYIAYFHLWPPHDPYATRREFVDTFNDGWMPLAKPEHFFSKGYSQEDLRELRRYYDEYIAYVDAEFARLYYHLEKTGSLKNTYLILTSDHGELFERGIDNHLTPVLFEPIIRIPLIIFKPGQEQREDIYSPTSCVDLVPTLASISGASKPDWCEGQILPSFAGQNEDTDRSLFVLEAKENPKHGPLKKATAAIIKNNHKLIKYIGYEDFLNRYELFDLENDPEEIENRYPELRSLFTELDFELNGKLKVTDKK